MLKIFIGYDDRQVLSFTTLVASIYETATKPVSVTPLILDTLPISRRGLTPFTYSRFLVPWLCNYDGPAIFMDSDMLFVSDVTELLSEINSEVAVSVVKSLDNYEQTSFMLINCSHPENRKLTPEFIQESQIDFHGMEWLDPSQVGSLDSKWNQLVGYQNLDMSSGNLHFTMGIPAFAETSTSEGGETWRKIARRATSATSWREIMGKSVHAVNIEGVKLPKYVWDFQRNQPHPEHFELVKTLVLQSKAEKQSEN